MKKWVCITEVSHSDPETATVMSVSNRKIKPQKFQNVILL